MTGIINFFFYFQAIILIYFSNFENIFYSTPFLNITPNDVTINTDLNIEII